MIWTVGPLTTFLRILKSRDVQTIKAFDSLAPMRCNSGWISLEIRLAPSRRTPKTSIRPPNLQPRIQCKINSSLHPSHRTLCCENHKRIDMN